MTGNGTLVGECAAGEAGTPEPAPEGGWLDELTPRQIVSELDRYIIGQGDAKKAVAIALRNRWRRQQVADDLREEILPNNLILIGPTGVGKTEIARRLARLAGAPFVKVEASKFTEVGYVGRDVESMIRDLVDTAVNLVRAEREDEVQEAAETAAEERLLDLLLPPVSASRPADAGARRSGPPGSGDGATGERESADPSVPPVFVAGPGGIRIPGAGQGSGVGPAGSGTRTSDTTDPGDREGLPVDGRRERTREKLRALLRDGKLEERVVEVEVQQTMSLDGMMVPMGMEGMDHSFFEMVQDMLPKRTKTRSVRVSEARRILIQEELDRLVDMDEVVNEALDRAEETGIVFLDEIDKVAGKRAAAGPDVSREGVQRDLLPVVEGSIVQTKYGFVRTDHVLFIAAGAFHVSKPSDLVPELQGRFPIRVELNSLRESDFVRILTEPENALVHQYTALVESEGAKITFSEDGVRELARIAFELNDRMENIGARRLQTVMTTLLETVLFELPDGAETTDLVVDREFVRGSLASIAGDEDLRKYIL